MNATQEKFIAEVGRGKFERALALAMLFVRSDARFVGLDKIRNPIAEVAALNALGGEFKPQLLRDKCVAGFDIGIELEDFLKLATAHVRSQMASQ